MRTRPAVLIMMMVCSVSMLLSTVLGSVSGQVLLVDDSTLTGQGPGSDDYGFMVLGDNPTVIGLRSLSGDGFNIRTYEDDIFFESSDTASDEVSFVVTEGDSGAEPSERGASVTSSTGNYVFEMENEVDRYRIGSSWVGSMVRPLGGPVLNFESPGLWDDADVYGPTVVYVEGKYHLWYTGNDGSTSQIGYATSEDGIQWEKHTTPVVIPEETWESNGVSHPSVLYEDGTYHMWYTGENGDIQAIGYATSDDGIQWTKPLSKPILTPGPSSRDLYGASQPSVVYNGTGYRMWYTGDDGSNYQICYADSSNGITWTKHMFPILVPVLDPDDGTGWDNNNVSEPSVIHDEGTFHMWYAGDSGSNTRIGYATSENGITWTRYEKNPVLDIGSRGSWDDVHLTDPAVIKEGTTYRMWYSGNDGDGKRIGYASSDEPNYWTKLEGAPEVLDAYVVTDVIEGLTYTMKLDVPSTLDLDMFVFCDTGGREDALTASTSAGTGTDESITFTAPISGDYVLVITNEDGGTGRYRVLAQSPPIPNIVGDLVADKNGKVSFEAEARYPALTEDHTRYPVWSVDISADGSYMAVGWDTSISFFSTESNIPLWTLDTNGIVYELKLSDSGEHLAVLCHQTLYFIDTSSGIPLWSADTGYIDAFQPGNRLDMSSDGRFVACKAWGNRVLVFDSNSNTPSVPYWDYDFGDSVLVVKLSGDGNYLAMGGHHSHEFRLASIPEKSIKWTYSNGDPFYSASISYDGSMISFGQGISHTVGLFDSPGTTPDWSYELSGRQFEQVMSDDGVYFASSNHVNDPGNSWSGFALWNSGDSQPIWEYQSSLDTDTKADAVDLDRNAKYVVGGCSQNTVYLFSHLADGNSGWSAADGNPVFTYTTDGEIKFNSVSISAEGNYFAAGSRDGSVYLFSTVGGHHLVWSWSSSQSAPVSGEYSWDFDASVDSDSDEDFTNDEDFLGPNATYVYDRNGLYTVTLNITADDSTYNTYTLQVTVSNFVPRVDAGENLIVDEGDVVDFAGSISDPGWPDPPTIEWNFGDGDIDSGTLTPAHTYADNGEYIVTLTVTDGDGDLGSDNLMVTVNNIAPSVNAGFDQTADEGDIISFSGSYTDPGWLDTHTIDWDFGDGSKVTGTLTPEYAYGDNGEYIVTLRITDDDGGIGTDILIVTVNNVAPTVNTGPDQTIQTDVTLSFNGSIIDPGWLDTHTIEWDFDDGTIVTGTLTPTHVYRENGVYEITLTVTDDDGEEGTDTLFITVNNVKSTHGWMNDLFNYGFSLTAAAIIAVLFTCLFTGNTEVGKYRLIPFISPLYSRLKKEEVLDHTLRSRIFEHVIQNPGDHYNNIKHELALNNGSLAYHLRTLEKEEFIKSRRDGIYKRFYPTGMAIPVKTTMKLSPMEKEIMRIIKQNPSIIQKEIAKVLKLSQQIVSYHVKLMIESGLLRAERHGKTFRYFCN